MRFSVPLPNWSYLKNFDALPCNPEIKIDFLSDVDGRTTPCNEGSNGVFNSLFLQLVQHYRPLKFLKFQWRILAG